MLNRVIMAAVFAMAVSVTASAQERLVPGDAFRDCAGCPEIVDVPAGMSKTDVRAMLAKMFARQRESAVVSKIMGADTRRHEPGGRRGPASQEKPKPRTTKQAMVKPRTSKGAPEVAPSTDGDGRPIDPLSGFSRAPADGAGAKAGAPKRVVVRRAPTLDLITHCRKPENIMFWLLIYKPLEDCWLLGLHIHKGLHR